MDRDSFATAYRPALENLVDITVGAVPGLIFTGNIQEVGDSPLGVPGVGTVTAVDAADVWVIAFSRRVWELYRRRPDA